MQVHPNIFHPNGKNIAHIKTMTIIVTKKQHDSIVNFIPAQCQGHHICQSLNTDSGHRKKTLSSPWDTAFGFEPPPGYRQDQPEHMANKAIESCHHKGT